MTYEELDALLDAGDVDRVAAELAEQRYLSGEQVQLIEAKLARAKAAQAPPPPKPAPSAKAEPKTRGKKPTS